MRQDIKSNIALTAVLSALSRSAGAVNSSSIDHASASSASFLISLGDKGAAGTLDAKVQYSPDNSSWTDYPASDPMGNDSSITQLIAAGSAQLNIVNPRGRYSRVVATVGVNACVFSVTAAVGPLRHIDQG